MGYTTYCMEARSLRASSNNYAHASVREIFTQQDSRRIHESMDPKNVLRRDCLDSEAHPATVPIILALDVTGSMHKIPHNLIIEGLPTLMGTLIQAGLADASLCFLAVGDHECDRAPLQIAQFESGDAELDMWLTRSFLEGGGGGNAGESYHLAWEFAAHRTKTDAWEKRSEKGFLFTIGDEPVLKSLPKVALKEIYGDNAGQYENADTEELLAEAQKKWNVFHLQILEGSNGKTSLQGWKNRLGENCVVVKDYRDMPKVLAETIIGKIGKRSPIAQQPKADGQAPDATSKKEEIIL